MLFKQEMKKQRTILAVIFFLSCLTGATVTCNGQSKLYVFGGMSTIFGSGNFGFYDQFLKFKYQTADVEYEKRLLGSFNVAAGLSLFNSGYSVGPQSFGSASTFKATYAALPLMLRWNAGNKNVLLVDLGLAPYYLANAHLSESITQFNAQKTVEGNITPYSNRFYFGSKFQMTVLINRFAIGWYFFVPFKGQSTLRDLDGHWGLNAQQSTYLLSNGFSDFQIIGFKAGVRIR
jgi:hypothetical protein